MNQFGNWSNTLWYHKNTVISTFTSIKPIPQSALLVKTGSGNGLVPPGTKPLPEPMLTQIYVAINITRPQWVKQIYMRTPLNRKHVHLACPDARYLNMNARCWNYGIPMCLIKYLFMMCKSLSLQMFRTTGSSVISKTKLCPWCIGLITVNDHFSFPSSAQGLKLTLIPWSDFLLLLSKSWSKSDRHRSYFLSLKADIWLDWVAKLCS